MKSRRQVAAVVISVALIVAVVLLYAHHHRIVVNRATCIDTLRQIDGAKLQWALEHGASSNAVPTWDDIYGYGGRGYPDWYIHYPPRCPSGGTYTIRRVADPPTCSFPGHVMPQ
jgi:hypothetical protein